MKKLTLITAVAVLAGGLWSCNKNESDPGESATINISAYYTVATPLSGNGTARVSTPSYNFEFNTYKGYGTLAGEGLSVGQSLVSFKTNSIFYGMASNQLFLVMGGSTQTGNVAPLDQPKIENFEAELTYNSATNEESLIKSLSGVLSQDPIQRPLAGAAGSMSQYLFLRFKYADTYQINTFWPDMLYRGETKTSWGEGEDQTYSSKEFTYRIKMNLNGNEQPTADVYFYNAKFAQKAPAVNFVLKAVPMTFVAGGYKIAGKDLVPTMVPEGTPNARFTFKKFDLTSTQEMTGVDCTYQVGETYTGSFKGNCVFLSKYMTEE